MAKIEFHKIWIEQCQGAEDVKERYGVERALGYLIGEKLLNFIDIADTKPEWAEELPKFVAKIKEIFQPWEINAYLENVKRVGPMGHACTDEQYEVFLRAGAVDDNAVIAAEQIVLLERAKELLL
jgi:hypothetical protein